MSLRILIVTQYFWPESFLINDFSQAMSHRGHDITVLTGVPNYPQGSVYPGYSILSRGEDYQGMQVVRVPLVPRGRSKGIRLAVNYISFAALASVLGPFRLREQFDLIFVFEPSPVTVGIPALVLRYLRNVPLLFWVQDLWPETLESLGVVRSPWVLKRIEQLVESIYRRCDRVLVQSDSFARSVIARGVSPENVLPFPNWATDDFRPMVLTDDAPEHRELPTGIRLLFAGNIGVSQSFKTLLSAAQLTRQCSDLKWIVIGDGRERDWLEREISQRGLSETFYLLPRKPPECMPRYFAAADALLVSLRRDRVFEMTIPSKLQSYLACGRPVLASLNGEGAQVVQDSKSGLVAPAEDPQALAQRALEMYGLSGEQRAAMGRAGRAYYESHFEREMLLDRLETAMTEVVSSRSTRCAA